jgi:glycosyltransferase involved in cell wall biosynthesis
MSTQRVIALLGKRDAPTDAVEEYCRYLGSALHTHDLQVEIRRVPWDSRGWSESLNALRLQAKALPPYTWFLVQYTALAWSNRGFPFRFFRVLKTLRALSACTVVVFHDVEPFAGSRPIDRFRRAVQLFTMRHAIAITTRSIFTVPMEKISWLPPQQHNAHFIPVGPNLPILESPAHARAKSQIPTVAVFSITGGEPGVVETHTIVSAVRHAAQKLGRLRLSVFGRNAESAEATLRKSLGDVPVEISVEGLLEERQLIERLSAADVLLFVRGPISSRRSSAIAGIACGLPVIAYAGSETAPPITDAGVVLVSPNNQDELNAALLRVLSDSAYSSDLAAKSRAAFVQHFSWPSIAALYASFLK